MSQRALIEVMRTICHAPREGKVGLEASSFAYALVPGGDLVETATELAHLARRAADRLGTALERDSATDLLPAIAEGIALSSGTPALAERAAQAFALVVADASDDALACFRDDIDPELVLTLTTFVSMFTEMLASCSGTSFAEELDTLLAA